MKKLFVILCGICMLVIFASCGNILKEKEPQILTEKRIVKAKTIENVDGSALINGRVYYGIAFTDGQTDYVTFGEYSNIEIGDTLTYTKKEGDYISWKLILN